MEIAFWKHEFKYDHHLINSMAAATLATARSYIVWKVPVLGAFLVRIFPHLDWIWRDTKYLWWKIGTKKTPNMGTFHAVLEGIKYFLFSINYSISFLLTIV